MKKILGLIASPRKWANSRVLVDHMLQTLTTQVGEEQVERLSLYDYKVLPCQGCLSCVYDGHCPVKDDGELLIKKLMTADGLIISAPTYIFGAASIIKTLIDRSLILYTHLDALALKKRYAVTISISGRKGWNYTAGAQLNQFALTYGFAVREPWEVYAPGPAEVVLQTDVMEQAKEKAQELHKMVTSSDKWKTDSPSSKNRCVYCAGDIFKLGSEGSLSCAICGAKVLGYDCIDGLTIHSMDASDSFFTMLQRKKHIEEWIIPSKEQYMARRASIMKSLVAYGLKKE